MVFPEFAPLLTPPLAAEASIKIAIAGIEERGGQIMSQNENGDCSAQMFGD